MHKAIVYDIVYGEQLAADVLKETRAWPRTDESACELWTKFR